MTIGRPQGAAWIGKPLSVVIPLTLDGSEVGGSLCPQVEVVQGDAAMDERRVSVSLEPGSAPDAPRLHVRTTRAIEEPIVTLTVKAGCAATSARQIVLLADPSPVEAALPSVGGFPDAARDTSSGLPAARPSNAQAARAPRVESRGQGGVERARRAPKPNATVRAPRSANPDRSLGEAAASPRRQVPAPRNSAPASGGGRLQIDALAPIAPREAAPARPAEAEAVPALSPSLAASAAARTDGLAVGPAATASAPAAAASAPASVAATPSGEALREAERTIALEKALATLREQTSRNEQTLLELRRELGSARDSRYSNPLVYVLVGLLLLALLGMLWMWRASRRAAQSVWWPEGGPEGGRGPSSRSSSRFGALDDDVDTLPGEGGRRAAKSSAALGVGGLAAASAANAESGGFEERSEEGEDPARDEARPTDFGSPTLQGQLPSSARSVNTEELFDVQQQAEFFLSLGQHEQAISVLSEYVADHPDTSALAYLELLRIFHALGRMLDFERVRRQCQQALNVRVPAFDDFQEAGRPLDHYNDVLERIEEHWPGPESLPVIEELLFRRPGADGAATFDLAAYRELLMLYAMAQEHLPASEAQRPSLAEVLMRHQQRETMPMPLGTETSAAVEPPTAPQSLGRDTTLLLEPRHQDFQPTRPPHPLTASLDFDLDHLDMGTVNTIPAALRRAAAGAEPEAKSVPDLDQPATELASSPPMAQLPEIDLFDPAVEDAIKPGTLKR